MNRLLRSFTSLGITLVTASASAASPEANALTDRQAVVRAASDSPTLRAALTELRDAALAVGGEEARYPWTLGLEAGATRTASPRLIQGENFVGEIYTLDTRAELQKRLAWGTDLAFSLRSAWQNSITPSSLQFIGLAPNGAIPTISFSARAGVTQPLLRGSGTEVTLANLHLARSRETQAGRRAERVASALVRDVLVAYWDYWFANEAMRIQVASSDLAVEQRNQALLRARSGSLAPVEVLAFETRVATREEEVATARVEVERTRVTLAARMGVLSDPGVVADVAERTPDIPDAPERDGLEARALEVSPEIAELEAALATARVQRRSAGDANRPRLDASAYFQLEGLGSADAGAALEQLAGFGAWSAHAGLSFDAPLDGSRRASDIARADAAIELAQARLEERRLDLVRELRTVVAREAGARRRRSLADETAARAAEQLEAWNHKYATGSATSLEVLQAEDELRNARLRVARATIDAVEQAVMRDHLTGALLLRHQELFRVQLGARGARLGGVFESANY